MLRFWTWRRRFLIFSHALCSITKLSVCTTNLATFSTNTQAQPRRRASPTEKPALKTAPQIAILVVCCVRFLNSEYIVPTPLEVFALQMPDDDHYQTTTIAASLLRIRAATMFSLILPAAIVSASPSAHSRDIRHLLPAARAQRDTNETLEKKQDQLSADVQA